jgi:hypothetical protein
MNSKLDDDEGSESSDMFDEGPKTKQSDKDKK